jgi:hypothetical protein
MVEPTRSSNEPASPRPRIAFFNHPSEEELLEAYLLPLVSESKSCPFIHNADVYAADPAKLTNAFASSPFSVVRAKSREGQRKARTVGGGCWYSEAGARPVVVEQPRRRLDHRQSFSFVTKEDGRRARSEWLIVELGLDGNDEIVFFSPRAHLLIAGATAAPARKSKAADAAVRRRRRNEPGRTAPKTAFPSDRAPAASPGANETAVAAPAQNEDDTQDGGVLV